MRELQALLNIKLVAHLRYSRTSSPTYYTHSCELQAFLRSCVAAVPTTPCKRGGEAALGLQSFLNTELFGAAAGAAEAMVVAGAAEAEMTAAGATAARHLPAPSPCSMSSPSPSPSTPPSPLHRETTTSPPPSRRQLF